MALQSISLYHLAGTAMRTDIPNQPTWTASGTMSVDVTTGTILSFNLTYPNVSVVFGPPVTPTTAFYSVQGELGYTSLNITNTDSGAKTFINMVGGTFSGEDNQGQLNGVRVFTSYSGTIKRSSNVNLQWD